MPGAVAMMLSIPGKEMQNADFPSCRPTSSEIDAG